MFLFSAQLATLTSLAAAGWEAAIANWEDDISSLNLLGLLYLAKAAFAQHHEEIEVMDSHSDFSRTWRVYGWAGRDRGWRQDHGKRLRHRGSQNLRQRGCCDIWLRFLEDHKEKYYRKTEWLSLIVLKLTHKKENKKLLYPLSFKTALQPSGSKF